MAYKHPLQQANIFGTLVDFFEAPLELNPEIMVCFFFMLSWHFGRLPLYLLYLGGAWYFAETFTVLGSFHDAQQNVF